jgi:hypothetical protein
MTVLRAIRAAHLPGERLRSALTTWRCLRSRQLGLPTSDLVDGVLAGRRRALAKAITLVESTRADHQQRAQKQVLEAAAAANRTDASASASRVCRASASRPSSKRSACI